MPSATTLRTGSLVSRKARNKSLKLLDCRPLPPPQCSTLENPRKTVHAGQKGVVTVNQRCDEKAVIRAYGAGFSSISFWIVQA